MVCDSSTKIHSNALLGIRTIIIICSTITNSLYSFALYKTSQETLSRADLLFLIQSAFDISSCLTYFTLSTINGFLFNDYCNLPEGWTHDQFLMYQKIMQTFLLIPLGSLVMPNVIATESKLVRAINCVMPGKVKFWSRIERFCWHSPHSLYYTTRGTTREPDREVKNRQWIHDWLIFSTFKLTRREIQLIHWILVHRTNVKTYPYLYHSNRTQL